MTEKMHTQTTQKYVDFTYLFNSIGLSIIGKKNTQFAELLENWQIIVEKNKQSKKLTSKQISKLAEELDSYYFSNSIYAAVGLLVFESDPSLLLSWGIYSLLKKQTYKYNLTFSVQEIDSLVCLFPENMDNSSLQVTEKNKVYSLFGTAKTLGKQNKNSTFLCLAPIKGKTSWGLFHIENQKIEPYLTVGTRFGKIQQNLFNTTTEQAITVNLLTTIEKDNILYMFAAWETWLSLTLLSSWKKACLSLPTKEENPILFTKENIHIQALLEGIKNTIFTLLFHLDCQEQGQVTNQIQLLTQLQSKILREFILQQSYQYHSLSFLLHKQQPADLQKWNNYIQIRSLLSSIEPNQTNLLDLLCYNNQGKHMGGILLEQMQTMTAQQVSYPPLKEALRLWQDYIASLYLFIQKLQESKNNKDALPTSALFSLRLNNFIGEITSNFQLLQAAMYAENTLKQNQVTFEEPIEELTLHPEYNKILLAYTYIINSLPYQESVIHSLENELSQSLSSD